MKVVFFSRFPEDISAPGGGVESATVNLALGLVGIGDVELHVVTFSGKVKMVRVEDVEGITVHRLPGSGWPQMLDVIAGPGRFRLKKYLNSLEPDIVHFHETYALGIGKLSVPHVFTVHGFDSENIPVESGKLGRMSWLRSPIWRFVEARGLMRQKYIISITPYVKEFIEPRTKARIYDIDNAISRSFFEIPRDEVPGRVFFAGWVSQRKNVLGLVKAFTVAAKGTERDVSLHIAGERRNAEYARTVDAEVENSGVSEKISFLGRVSQEEILRELSEASMFVLASYQENAPMVIAESMAAGVPVISSDRCGMKFMIKDGETGYLVDPDDTEALSDRMKGMMTDDHLRGELSRAARAYSESRFHPDVVARKTREVYEEIIGENRVNWG